MERSTLIALFLREGAPDRWDLIVSAPWAWADQDKALDYMIAKIKSDMEPGTLTRLSRIVFMNPMDPTVQKLNQAIRVEHCAIEVRDSNFFGLQIERAIFITSKAPTSLAA